MKFVKKGISVILSVLMVVSIFAISCTAEKADNKASVKDGSCSDFVLENWNKDVQDAIDVPLSSVTTTGTAQADKITIAKDQSVSFSVNVAEAGKYRLGVKYSITAKNAMDVPFNVTIDGETIRCSLPLLWYDETKQYEKDYNGNQVVPDQISVGDFVYDVVRDETLVDLADLTAELAAGQHTITITAVSLTFDIAQIKVLPEEEFIPYSEYIAQYKGVKDVKDLFEIEGENYSVKSESYIRGKATKDPAVQPHTSGLKTVSTLDGATWSKAGQKIAWEIEAPKDGLYEITVNYNQNTNANQNAYRRIEIDGVVPFAEFTAVNFPATESGEYELYTLQNKKGEPFKVYLTKGSHILSMQVAMGDFAEAYEELIALMDEINAIGMKMEMLAAGSTDTNRTWDMEIVLPGTMDELKVIADRIYAAYDKFEKITGETPVYADTLKRAADQLLELLEKPRVLPNKTDYIHVGDSSVSKYIGTVVSQLISAPISLDTIYVSSGKEIPDRDVSFWVSLWEGIVAFFDSFTTEYTSAYSADIAENGEGLTVWVNRSVQYTEMIQRLLDKGYNKEHGTAIRLSIMPSEQKLILANAAGTNPDLVLSTAGATPFNFAVRNSAFNFLKFDDFFEFFDAGNRFTTESLVPLTYNGGVYGVPETRDFSVLFYRTDILESLGLEVPETWDDVKYMMPTLLRYNMQIYIPLSAAAGYKPYGATAPFIFQNNGELFDAGGTSVSYDNAAGLEAFNLMVDLYNVYGMQNSIASLYDGFRYSEIPMGIGGSGLYLQLNAAAPEVAGKWDIAMSPGVRVDGQIQRYLPANATSCMIFDNRGNEDEAWDLLKWWLSDEVQAEYAHLMSSTYGPDYFWCSANLNAFKQSSVITEEHKEIILEQWQWQKEVVMHPANYIVERSISNAWVDVVVNGKELADSLDNSVLTANREIIRKLKEFGYVDSNGNVIKPYNTDPLSELDGLK